MKSLQLRSIDSVGDLRRWLEPLPDDQMIEVDIVLLDDPDISNAPMESLKTWIVTRDSWRHPAKKEWRRRYGFDFPRYGSGPDQVEDTQTGYIP